MRGERGQISTFDIHGWLRPLRVEFEDAICHLCIRGNARRRIFLDDQDRRRFLELLKQSAQRFDVSIFSFVLMGNHVHLVAQTYRPNLGRWMHWLNVSYTTFFNRRHKSSGHLFQERGLEARSVAMWMV